MAGLQTLRTLAPVQPADASHALLLRQSLSLVHAAPFACPDCARKMPFVFVSDLRFRSRF